MKYIKYSQKQTFYCSIKLVLIFFLLLASYSLIALYTGLIMPSFFILIPLVLGALFIPIQALLFDWFQANGKSLEIIDNKIVYKYSPSPLFSDTDEIEIYNMNNIENIKINFQGYTCLQSIKINFKDKKNLYIMGFYIKNTDFKDIINCFSLLSDENRI